MYNASPEDVEIIYAYIESISVQRNIPVNVSDSIEETEKLWMEKAEAAKVILERTDSFVEVILAYYNKMEGQK